jgi:nicotinamidase/pyrazinamidase
MGETRTFCRRGRAGTGNRLRWATRLRPVERRDLLRFRPIARVGPGAPSFRVVSTPYDTRTALVVVDVQNDFAHPDGSLYVRDADAAIRVVNREVAAAHDAGALVVTTQDWHPADTPHFAKDGGTWPVHCVAGSWGAQLHDDFAPGEHEQVVKGVGGEDGYSGFSMIHPTSGETRSTGLDELLRGRGIERVVVVGLATDYCVRATALDAVTLGYETTVVVDGTRPVEVQPGDGQRAVDEMADAGVALA